MRQTSLHHVFHRLPRRFQQYLPLLAFILLPATAAYAQGAYSCDFEDEAENGNWTLNSGANSGALINRWFIGTGTNNGGKKSLYISSDPAGATTDYMAKGQTAVAYREMTLPAGSYELSFDWQAVGLPSDGLYACWMPAAEQTPSMTSNGNLPPWVTIYASEFDGTTKLNSSPWKTVSDTIVSDGVTTYKLLFAWNNGDVATAPPAACIDNIYILPVSSCRKPENIDVTSDHGNGTLTITWDGMADSYDVRCMMPGKDEWQKQTGITGNSLTLDNHAEGPIYVYIRSNCGGVYTSWVSYSHFVWFPGLRCIELFDLNDENCFIGGDLDPRATTQKVDLGYKNRASRHTIHYDIYETDPRTDGNLRTVPEGEIASIRLGNWNIGSEAECIEYQYTVDTTDNAILLLKYAAVLQDPGHPAENQPRFTLRVLDEDGESLDETCIDADFVAGLNTQGWIQAVSWGERPIPSQLEGSEPPKWKDWTTIGVNLKDHHGKNLTISLRTYDCNQTGHYGYAYFTINCSDAKVRGLSCGEMDENIFEAPDGFRYLWYVYGDESKTPVSTAQRLVINDPTDTRTYACDVISLAHSECYYTIYASAEPRYPWPHATYTVSDAGCQNTVTFTDESCVIRINPETGDTTYEAQECDSVFWNFDMDNGGEWVRDEDPVHLYPQEGGTFRVGMRAHLAECVEYNEFTLTLPELGYKRDTIHAHICQGEGGIEFGGGIYGTAGCYSDTIPLPGEACDSISTLDLTVGIKTDTVISDTICTGDMPHEFMGETYTEGGTYTITIDNSYQCDSVITYNLIVNESLDIQIGEEAEACADDGEIEIPYTLASGIVSGFDVTFRESGINEMMGITDGEAETGTGVIAIPMAEGVIPDHYVADIVFKNMECGDTTIAVTININYPDSIVIQRWNDVLGIRNSTYNGGYEFAAFQWYKDGQPIEGAIHPNLYQPEGLDTDALYHAALTRTDDGATVLTCPIQPIRHADTDIEVTPTVTFAGGSVEVKSRAKGEIRVWSTAGTAVSRTRTDGTHTTIKAPSAAGVYIIEITLDNGTRHTEKIIVRNIN